MSEILTKRIAKWGVPLVPFGFLFYMTLTELSIYEHIYPYVRDLPYYPEEIKSGEKTIETDRCKKVIDNADDAAVTLYGSLHKIHLVTFSVAFVVITILSVGIWKRDRKIERFDEESL